MRPYINSFIVVLLFVLIVGAGFFAARFYERRRYVLMGVFIFLWLVIFALTQGVVQDIHNGPYEGFL